MSREGDPLKHQDDVVKVFEEFNGRAAKGSPWWCILLQELVCRM